MTPTSTIFLSAKDTTRLIRQALKAAFPTTKFSVRLSAGGSANIHWTDGPTVDAVNAIAGYYAGSTFDGMIDLRESITRQEGSEHVHYGVEFVLYHRTISAHALEIVVADLRERYGWTHPITWQEYPTIGVQFTSESIWLENWRAWDQNLIWTEVAKRSFEDPPAEIESPTGLTWRRNPAKHGLELLGHPNEYTRSILKENGFRWHAKNHYWYAPETPDRLAIVQTLGREEYQ